MNDSDIHAKSWKLDVKFILSTLYTKKILNSREEHISTLQIHSFHYHQLTVSFVLTARHEFDV
jgi:hypothetical protein